MIVDGKVTYPEHDRMSVVQDQIEALREFVGDWADQHHVAICKLVDSGKRTGFGAEVVMEYQPVFRLDDLVYEFFDIDSDKIEKERRAMLDDLRSKT